MSGFCMFEAIRVNSTPEKQIVIIPLIVTVSKAYAVHESSVTIFFKPYR